MERVLGLAICAAELRWVLVDGATGAGAAVDSGVLAIDEPAGFDPEPLIAELADGQSLHAVGLSWSAAAETAAMAVHAALKTHGLGPAAVAITQTEALKVLAAGVAERAGCPFVVVCDIEPDATAVATVGSQRLAVERVERPDSPGLIDEVAARVAAVRPRPDAIFVLGSGDVDALVAAVDETATQPVITASEAAFALPRGVALAAARAVPVAAPPPVATRRRKALPAALIAAGAAAVVAVAGVSIGVGTNHGPEPKPARPATAAEQPEHQPPAPDAPRPQSPAVVEPQAPPPVADEPAPQAPPPALEEPAPEPAPGLAPEPVFAPPPAAPPPPPPRLRDRVFDKFPSLNRFR
ncbi:hypothetical protein BHQ15_09685 [Mycolicibacillus koreensis]|nr:hypothetical protein BHQ15_09685 [Mycolicibacillus koreensis]